MAKITFEAGDVISYCVQSKKNSNEFEVEYLGVCLDEKRWIRFVYDVEDKPRNLHEEETLGEIQTIEEWSWPITIYGGVPDCWHQMFKALVTMAKVEHKNE